MVRPTAFEITEQTNGETHLSSIVGELDLSTIKVLARHVDTKLGENPTTLTLDLTDLTFMDSTGLRLLIDLHNRSRREGWKLTLIPSKHEAANTVFRLTGADTALPFEGPPS
ncbi:MAG TPA: STAS domain-containing protein [Solirubrobacteraceae bacterium]